ncbi:MAG: hypothetical protein AVDCRST_MAG87-2736, partial [uncultured Thermomicrobiales bacterium]
ATSIFFRNRCYTVRRLPRRAPVSPCGPGATRGRSSRRFRAARSWSRLRLRGRDPADGRIAGGRHPGHQGPAQHAFLHADRRDHARDRDPDHLAM